MCDANIGTYKYHASFVEKNPQLVAQFIDLDEAVDQNSFTIGGIEGNGGTRVTHLVSYKIPDWNTQPPEPTVKSFNGEVVRSKAYLQVSEGLPCVSFPLGDDLSEDNQPTLEGGCDSMCGANIGNYKYHASFVQKNPQLVAQFIDLEEAVDQNSFTIGGIEGNGGTRVTHLVSYKTPYRINSKVVIISLGLGDFVVRTLFSYPFPKSLKASILLESNTLVCGALGAAFKLTIKRPEPPSASAPTASDGIPIALMAKASKSVETLSSMSEQLTNAFAQMAIHRGIKISSDPPPENRKATHWSAVHSERLLSSPLKGQSLRLLRHQRHRMGFLSL